jgi:2-polyprenyl-6-hydroxyphenyl methylase/3-demethylubiquinone-9 3-methyltransferase
VPPVPVPTSKTRCPDGVARRHAEDAGLDIDYRHATAEDLAAEGARFDIVLALEIVEHVADRDLFLGACGTLVAPGGMMVLATLNRTLKAWALAIVGAEYVLGWLPRGTHDWDKFVRPHEIARGLRASGLKLAEVSGVSYSPLAGDWRLSRDTDVNYMALALKD